MTTNRTDQDDVLPAASPPASAFSDAFAANGSPIGRSVKVSERIAAALVADIVQEGLLPGARLPNEAAMLERFQVGRASLREALRVLEIYGLISLQPGPRGGPVVSAIDADSVGRTFSLYLNLAGARMIELQEARLQIEPVIARMAAEEQNPHSMARLREALEAEAAVAAGDNSYIDAANNFHSVLATLSTNKVMNLIAIALRDLYVKPFVAVGGPSQTTEPSIRDEHRAIGEAILAGDADLAEELTHRHVAEYLERLKKAAPDFANSLITWR